VDGEAGGEERLLAIERDLFELGCELHSVFRAYWLRSRKSRGFFLGRSVVAREEPDLGGGDEIL
jgi:hypothetical protein